MELTENMKDIIEHAEGKALATVVPGCLHVVPVSTVQIVDNTILLVNYFMGKTLENILVNPDVSLACWRGLEGFQIKAQVEYVTEGDIFTKVVTYVAQTLPDRVVKGVLILSPYEVYDVSATTECPGKKVLSEISAI